VAFYWLGFENHISADGIERRRLGKTVAFAFGFSASLKPPHLVVESLVG
jgi:hypothetical protein